MITKGYFTEYDLITFEGDVVGETRIGDDEQGCLLFFSDGTVLRAVWDEEDETGCFEVVHRGHLLSTVIRPVKTPATVSDEEQDEDEEEISTDVAVFNHGVTWAYGADNVEAIES